MDDRFKNSVLLEDLFLSSSSCEEDITLSEERTGKSFLNTDPNENETTFYGKENEIKPVVNQRNVGKSFPIISPEDALKRNNEISSCSCVLNQHQENKQEPQKSSRGCLQPNAKVLFAMPTEGQDVKTQNPNEIAVEEMGTFSGMFKHLTKSNKGQPEFSVKDTEENHSKYRSDVRPLEKIDDDFPDKKKFKTKSLKKQLKKNAKHLIEEIGFSGGKAEYKLIEKILTTFIAASLISTTPSATRIFEKSIARVKSMLSEGNTELFQKIMNPMQLALAAEDKEQKEP